MCDGNMLSCTNKQGESGGLTLWVAPLIQQWQWKLSSTGKQSTVWRLLWGASIHHSIQPGFMSYDSAHVSIAISTLMHYLYVNLNLDSAGDTGVSTTTRMRSSSLSGEDTGADILSGKDTLSVFTRLCAHGLQAWVCCLPRGQPPCLGSQAGRRE